MNKINVMKTFIVGTEGIEPTCDQLPFLQGISLRGYVPVFVIPLRFELKTHSLGKVGRIELPSGLFNHF